MAPRSMENTGASGPSWSGRDIEKDAGWRISHDALGDSPDALRRAIRGGLESHGFLVIGDLPLGAPSEEGAAARLLADLAARIGVPVSQSAKLDFLGRVTDVGGDIRNHAHRGYESDAELPFHSDRCDLLALLCVRQAPKGGATRLASAQALWSELARRDPEAAAILREPVPFDLRDTTGARSWEAIPVFSGGGASGGGAFVARYVRRFIEASQRFEDAPRLTPAQVAAMDALDAILAEPGVALDLRLRPGELLVVDNHRILHARTEFEDAPGAARKRLLMRMWLCWEGSPPLPEAFASTYGRTGAGTYRGGVWPEDRPLSRYPAELAAARRMLREDEERADVHA